MQMFIRFKIETFIRLIVENLGEFGPLGNTTDPE